MEEMRSQRLHSGEVPLCSHYAGRVMESEQSSSSGGGGLQGVNRARLLGGGSTGSSHLLVLYVAGSCIAYDSTLLS